MAAAEAPTTEVASTPDYLRGIFRWRVNDFASLNPTPGVGTRITFSCVGHRWYLLLYPGGSVPEHDEMTFLYMGPAGPAKEELRVKYSASVVRPGEEHPAARYTAWYLWEEGDQEVHGFAVAARDDLLDKESGFLSKDGAITFQVEVALFQGVKHSRGGEVDVEEKKKEARLQVAQSCGFLQESGLHSDVILKCEDTEIPAHKAILSARSPVFKAMFTHQMAETKEGVVQVEDMEPWVLRELVRFLYTGECAFVPPDPTSSALSSSSSSLSSSSSSETKEGEPQAEAASVLAWQCQLYAAADRFQVSALQDLLEEIIGARPISAEDFLERLFFAERCGAPKTKKRCIEYLRSSRKNVAELMASQSFRRLAKENPANLAAVVACFADSEDEGTAAARSGEGTTSEHPTTSGKPKVGSKRSREDAGLYDDGDDTGGA